MKDQNQTIQVEKAGPLKLTQLFNATWDKKVIYEGLCRGDKNYVSLPSHPAFKKSILRHDSSFKIKPLKPLHCRYLNDHPFLVIGPIKEEAIHDNPPVWRYYDTITEKQAEYLKRYAIPKVW